jgi:hypothetical protein
MQPDSFDFASSFSLPDIELVNDSLMLSAGGFEYRILLSLEIHLGVIVSPQPLFLMDFVTLLVSASHYRFGSLQVKHGDIALYPYGR